jgi:hypothetical protein
MSGSAAAAAAAGAGAGAGAGSADAAIALMLSLQSEEARLRAGGARPLLTWNASPGGVVAGPSAGAGRTPTSAGMPQRGGTWVRLWALLGVCRTCVVMD